MCVVFDGTKSVIVVSCGAYDPQENVNQRSNDEVMSDFLAYRGLSLDKRADNIRAQGLKILSEGVDD